MTDHVMPEHAACAHCGRSKRYITRKELARRWDVDYKTLANWNGRQGPKPCRISGLLRYDLHEIEAIERRAGSHVVELPAAPVESSDEVAA